MGTSCLIIDRLLILSLTHPSQTTHDLRLLKCLYESCFEQVPLKVTGAKRGVTVSHDNCTLASGTPADAATGIASLVYSCKVPGNETAATTVTFTAKGGGNKTPLSCFLGFFAALGAHPNPSTAD